MPTPVEARPEAPPVTVATAPRKPGRKRPLGTWIALGVLALLIAVVASTMKGSAFVYSKYVDEILPEASHWVGRTVRIEGLVAPGSIENRPGASEYRFRVTRNHAEILVHYTGIVPDTFRDCSGVTVRGVLGRDRVFEANEIIAKCPSKYEAATVVNGQCIVGTAPPAGHTAPM